eukprot:scaffold25065_cov68-Phaeocystis_antarctica.AAC.8
MFGGDFGLPPLIESVNERGCGLHCRVPESSLTESPATGWEGVSEADDSRNHKALAIVFRCRRKSMHTVEVP